MRPARILETGSIRSRLTGALLLLGAVSVLGLGSCLVLIARTSGDARRIELAASLRMGAFAVAAYLGEQAEHPDTGIEKRIESELERMETALAAMESGSPRLRIAPVRHAEGRAAIAATRTALHAHRDLALRVLAECRSGRIAPERHSALFTEALRSAESLRTASQQLVSELERHGTAAIDRLMLLQAGAALAALVVLLLTLWAVNRFVLQAVPPLVEGLAEVRRGRYGIHVEVRGENELSRVAAGFNAMSSELERSHHALVMQQAEILEKNRALERASTLKSQFVANMSHELRTPLHAIIGYTKLLRTGIYGEVPQSMLEPLRGIDETSESLLRLIKDVLDVARIEAGRMDLDIQPFDIQRLVQDVSDMLQPLAAAKGLGIYVRAETGFSKVTTDQDKVRRILLNLGGNAIKFTRRGRVEIDLMPVDASLARPEAGGPWFEIAVRDTGPGIAAENLEIVFEDFRQLDGSTTREHGGAGLGLAISRRLARHLGGDVRVESRVGEGSTFTLRLPVFVHVNGREEAVSATESPNSGSPTPSAPSGHALT